MVKVIESSKTGSPAEDRFISLFCDVFGPKNSKYLLHCSLCRLFCESNCKA